MKGAKQSMATLMGWRHIVGTSKKTGKPVDAYIVSYLEPERDEKAVGYKAEQQFVETQMFVEALAGRKAEEVLNGEVDLVFNKSGFLDGFYIHGKAASK